MEDKLMMAVFAVIILIISIVSISNVCTLFNPFAPRGEIIGYFVEGNHDGFGEFCGQYPYSNIKLRNAIYDDEHFMGTGGWFHFGNQYEYIDEMVVGEVYTIHYHQEGRPSDTTSGECVHYWVIDDIKVGW